MDASRQRKKGKKENLIVDHHQDLFQYQNHPHHLERNSGIVGPLYNVEMIHGLLQREALWDIRTIAPTGNHTMITDETLMKGMDPPERNITMKGMETMLQGIQIISQIKGTLTMTAKDLDLCNMKEEGPHRIEVRVIIMMEIQECVDITLNPQHMQMIFIARKTIPLIEIDNDLNLLYGILSK